MKNFSIRLFDDQKESVARVSALSRLSEADIIRMCVAGHLPIVTANLEKAAAKKRAVISTKPLVIKKPTSVRV